MSDLYERVLGKQGVGFVICDEGWAIERVSSEVGQLVDVVGESIEGMVLTDLFPEMFGLEGVLAEVWRGERAGFAIEKVARAGVGGGLGYVTLGVEKVAEGLLVMIRDVTKEGTLEQRITQQRNELGVLAQELAIAKEKLNRLLHQYVPAEVARKMLANPEAARPGGARQEVTVLFADLRNFTRWAEHMEPTVMMKALNKKLSVAVEIIQAHGGILDKFMGDAVMGLFNAPEADAEHALHGAQAALALVRAMRDDEVTFSVGVNTGEAFLGNLGTEAMMNYTAVGDAVNQAKRIQEMALQGYVYIGEETQKLLGERAVVKSLGTLRLRGREQTTEVYELIDIEERIE
ncbi:MAG TPA: adenylate/guanylate cyclase domain-containing protein [Anaerolineae bacterium]|nr:adenylate/guanylate cyclase domain-containing protein [Anaerolineae bacterium]